MSQNTPEPPARCKHDRPFWGECPDCENDAELALQSDTAAYVEKLKAEIARLRQIEADALAAGLLGQDGNMRKVLGQLPLTADGCVVGLGAVIWHAHLLGPTGHVSLQINASTVWGEHETCGAPSTGARLIGGAPDMWYSTLDAAEAAREKAGGE
jgi:hypothetical protein